MHLPRSTFRRSASAALVALALGVGAACATAAEPSFANTLTTTEQSAAGLAKLSTEQRTTLDAQIQREITLARQGDVVGFATTFSQRRTADERTAAGLDRLTAEELVQLDAAIARAVAQRPAMSYSAQQGAMGTAVALRRKPEIHGEVSFVYGWGSGDREFYGGSVTTHYYDPESKVGVSIGISQLRGKGFGYGYGYDGYGYGGYPGYYCPHGHRGRW